MKAIILAAGQGKRLGNLTHNKPKCLLPLGSETILERELRLLQNAGINKNDIYVIGGYKHEQLKPLAPNLIINTDYNTKENSYSLALALQNVYDDDLIILDSDLCFEEGLIEKIISCPHKNVLASKKNFDTTESTGIVTLENGKVSAIGKQYKNTGYVYISIFKISKAFIKPFKNALLDDNSITTWYPTAITNLCSEYDFYNLVVTDKWHEIDFSEDYYETLSMFHIEN